MATIRELTKKNGKKTYHVEVRITGYKPMRATFDRKTDAKTWASELESKMRRGKKIKDAEAQKHTLNELIERYIENELPQRKSDQEKFKMQLKWWQKEIGAFLLSDITPSLLSQCKDKLGKEDAIKPKNGNKTRSNATINRYLACLSIVLSKGVKEWEWLEENPMLKVTKKTEPKGRTRYLTDDERNRLLNACKEQSYELYLLVLIAVCTGARYGEITNLKWQNIDFENRLFHFLNTKNGENRGVPFSSIVYKELQAFAKVRNIKSDYIFVRPDGKKIIYFKGMFYNAMEQAEIKNFKFHDLRHTAASYLAMNGASLLEIAEILGHKTLAMVKRYSHLTQKHTANLIESMNTKKLGGING